MLATPTVVLKDDFRQGLDLRRTWALLRLPPSLIADDGIASISDQGLHVRAAGTNPLTVEPAFTKTLARRERSRQVDGRYTAPFFELHARLQPGPRRGVANQHVGVRSDIVPRDTRSEAS